MGTVEERLVALPTMSSAELRDLWIELTGKSSPRISPKLLRLALAWEIQASVYGGLPRATRQRLAQIAGGKTRTAPAQAGMRLVREWNGETPVVIIGEDKGHPLARPRMALAKRSRA